MIPGTHKDIINQQNLTSKFRFVLLYLRRWHVPLRFRLTVRVFPSLGHKRLLGRKCNSNAGSQSRNISNMIIKHTIHLPVPRLPNQRES